MPTTGRGCDLFPQVPWVATWGMGGHWAVNTVSRIYSFWWVLGLTDFKNEAADPCSECYNS